MLLGPREVIQLSSRQQGRGQIHRDTDKQHNNTSYRWRPVRCGAVRRGSLIDSYEYTSDPACPWRQATGAQVAVTDNRCGAARRGLGEETNQSHTEEYKYKGLAATVIKERIQHDVLSVLRK